MSAPDVYCPYCDGPQEICDEYYTFEEGIKHEQQCGDCEKTFTYQTSISYSFDAKKADCLNGAAHKLKPSFTFPVKMTKMRCADCEYERPLTDDEMAVVVAERGQR